MDDFNLSHDEEGLTNLHKDLRLHFNTLRGWIRSCNDEKQIPICKQAVKTLIVDKFNDSKDIDGVEFMNIVIALEADIKDQYRHIRYYAVPQ